MKTQWASGKKIGPSEKVWKEKNDEVRNEKKKKKRETLLCRLWFCILVKNSKIHETQSLAQPYPISQTE